MLATGEIAAAPVSAFACFANPDLLVCPGICIAADGPVHSVLLLSKMPIEDIERIALDTSSLSAANMLRIILDEAYGLRPEFVRAAPDVPQMLARCDAALVIGDPAMLYQKNDLIVMDIAEEWVAMTGLPAVFAVWAGKGIGPTLVDILYESRTKGLGMIHEIARIESARLNLPFEVCDEYLSDIMIYNMGDREQMGFELFRDKAIRHGLVESPEAEVATIR
jgi:chorismate dehydratase